MQNKETSAFGGREEKNINVGKIIIPILTSGGIGVLPTDTLYGVVGSALQKETVERIYKLRKRDLDKPMIILISALDDLKLFGIKITSNQKKTLAKFWPGKVSVILDCPSKKFQHLHRGVKSLAIRLPAGEAGLPENENLLQVLRETGPLVAPSANMSGQEPAETYEQARKYFGDNVDFYVDAGKLKSKPSTLIRLDEQGNITVLRPGAVKI